MPAVCIRTIIKLAEIWISLPVPVDAASTWVNQHPNRYRVTHIAIFIGCIDCTPQLCVHLPVFRPVIKICITSQFFQGRICNVIRIIIQFLNRRICFLLTSCRSPELSGIFVEKMYSRVFFHLFWHHKCISIRHFELICIIKRQLPTL